MVPNFKVFGCIGTGGYGRVWLARDVIGQWRAIKTVRRERFQGNPRAYSRELDAIKRYAPVSGRHENLLRIFYVGPDKAEEGFYYVMELADPDNGAGSIEAAAYRPRTLRSYLETVERLPAAQCVSLGLSLTTALDELHRCGLIHRDIKPSNIIFVEGKPKLADIGLVGVLGEAQSRVGTEGYIPTEGPGLPAADVYALGKVLYVASTGLEPGKFPELPVTALSADQSGSWFELNVVLVKACAVESKQRYQNAAEMRQDLLLLEAKTSLLRRNQLHQRLAHLKVCVLYLGLAVLVLLPSVFFFVERAGAARQRVATLKRESARLTAEQNRESAMRQAQESRRIPQSNGWTANHSNALETARQIRADEDLWAEAAAGLTGLELKLICSTRNVGGSWVSFGTNGTVLFGGLSDSEARAYIPGKHGFEALSQAGAGPVGFDRNGQMLHFVSAGPGEFMLRSLSTGEQRRFNLSSHWQLNEIRPAVLAATPDLSIVAAGSQQTGAGCFAIWESDSGKMLLSGDEPVTAMALSADGRCFAAGGRRGQVRIWSLPDGAEGRPVSLGRASIQALAFAPDVLMPERDEQGGRSWLLAVGDEAAAIGIYRVPSGSMVSSCTGSSYEIRSLAFRSDGALLASGGREKVRIWDVAKGKQMVDTGAASLDKTDALAFSRNALEMAVVSKNMNGEPWLSVWEIEEGRGIQTLCGLSTPAEQVWWSQDGRQVAALDQKWELGIWAMPQGRLTHLIEVPQGDSQDNAAVAFDRDGGRLAFAAGQEVRMYDLSARCLLARWNIPRGLNEQLQFESADRLLLLHSESDSRRGRENAWALWRLSGQDHRALVHEQDDTNWLTHATRFSTNSQYFMVGGLPRATNTGGFSVKLISAASGREITNFAGEFAKQYSRMLTDPAGGILVHQVAGNESYCRCCIRTLPQGNVLESINHIPSAVSPNAEWFAGGLEQGKPGWSIYQRGAYERPIRIPLDLHAWTFPKFSPDGAKLALPTQEGHVLIADIEAVQQKLRGWGWMPR